MFLGLHSFDEIFNANLTVERAKLIDFNVFNQIEDVPRVRLECELWLIIDVLSKLRTDGKFLLLCALNTHFDMAAEHIDLFCVDYLLCSVVVETCSWTGLLVCWIKGVNH